MLIAPAKSMVVVSRVVVPSDPLRIDTRVPNTEAQGQAGERRRRVVERQSATCTSNKKRTSCQTYTHLGSVFSEQTCLSIADERSQNLSLIDKLLFADD